MVRAHEAVIRILQVRLERNDRLSRQLVYLPLDVADVSAAGRQFFKDIRQKLLRGVISAVHERSVRLLELVRVLIQRVVGQVHIEISQVHTVRFLVVLLKKINDKQLRQRGVSKVKNSRVSLKKSVSGRI